jgi:hypothetical protein
MCLRLGIMCNILSLMAVCESNPIVTDVSRAEVEFEAIRCNNVKTTASYRGRKFCDERDIKKEYGIQERYNGDTFTLIQMPEIRKFRGIRCQNRMSSITTLCGAFSHSKLTVSPDVLVPVKVTERECIEVAQSQLLTTEDQRQVRVLMGSTVNYKYIESGSEAMLLVKEAKSK